MDYKHFAIEINTEKCYNIIKKGGEKVNIYDVWIDWENKVHIIKDMDTNYIISVVRQINKASNSWRMKNFDDLSQNDLNKITEPLQKAWYVVSAREYLKSFKKELQLRNENLDEVERALEYASEELY